MPRHHTYFGFANFVARDLGDQEENMQPNELDMYWGESEYVENSIDSRRFVSFINNSFSYI